MSKKKRVPELRFRGFEDEWEEKELGEVASFSKGRGYSKNDLIENGIPIFLYGRLYTKYQTVVSEVDTYTQRKSNSLFSIGNEVVMPASGETAEDIARASAVIQSNIILGGDLNVLYPNNNIHSIYLALNISYGRPQRELPKRAQGKSIVHLHNSDLKDISISYPVIKEQIKIGRFSQNIDNLITFHQRKYDKLCMFKKAMLEKMFTKDNTSAPEIRFKKFAGKWNKNPLNFYLDPSTEKNYEGKYNKENVLSVSGEFGIVNQIEFQGRSFAGASVANYGIVHTGDVVYTKSPLKSNPYGIIKANMGKDGIVSTLYAVYKAKKVTYSCFVNYYFCSDFRLNCYLKPLVNKGAKNDMKVTSENALLGKVIFPQIIEEQIKIAAFFEKVDSLISLHQRELDKLKHIKQACIEKMFV